MKWINRVTVALAALMLLGVTAVAQAATSDTFGKATTEQRLLPDGATGFNFLGIGLGEDYIVRDGSEDSMQLGAVKANREKRRTSISYFGQLTDFQLADEESPARVEFLDPDAGPYTSSWRPNEAFNPFEEDAMIRQFNHYSTNAPNRDRANRKPKMDFVVNTGDIADNSQYNETLWNRQLLEGNTVNPGSGVDPAPYIGEHPLCPAGLDIKNAANPTAYTGVQDRSLWDPTPTMGYFWDPNQPDPGPGTPVKPYADAPTWPGLMDRAQKPFKATGLNVPSYMVFGNHDALVQGNVSASQIFNEVATGCLKPINDAEENSGRDYGPLFGFITNPYFDADKMLALYASNPEYFMAVPPDPDRRLISKKEFKDVFAAGGDPSGHGFKFIDAAENRASNFSAGYYSFSPRRGVRYIVLDTNSEGGRLLQSNSGNLDSPQFKWMESKLQLATKNNEVAIVFSHHAIPSLTANVPDEEAPACGTEVNQKDYPGCDADPRNSEPIKLGPDLETLMHKYPAAIAWVAGHSHSNNVAPYQAPDGKSGFWSIRTAALADWPKQNRLVELFDNRDGNLSLFGTLIDHAAPVETPAPGTEAADMSVADLGAIGRTIGYNDTQKGGRGCGANPCGEGTPADRNVELVIKDPRKPRAMINWIKVRPKKRKIRAGKKLKLTVKVSNFVTATAAAKQLKVKLKSSNRRVKVRKIVRIKKIRPGTVAKFKVTVKVKRNARGRARITVRTAGKQARTVLNIKKLKKKHKKRNRNKRKKNRR